MKSTFVTFLISDRNPEKLILSLAELYAIGIRVYLYRGITFEVDDLFLASDFLNNVSQIML